MAKLNVKQELAINELLKGNSIVESAKIVGVSEATLNRWLVNSEFKAVLNERKSLIVDNCIDKINLMGNKAITVLDNILDNDSASDNVKFNVSKNILEMILKFNEQRNIIDKMKELFKEYDCLILPVSSGPAKKLNEDKDVIDASTCVIEEHLQIGNFGGFPSITIPNGFINNLPVGINMTGNCYDDANILNIAYTLEGKMPYKNQIAKEMQK